MSNKMQYIISSLILLLGLVISAVILLATFLPRKENTPAETTDAVTAETTKAAETEKYTVTFYDAKGNVMQTNTVFEGESVLPPDIHSKTQAFKGWSQKLFFVNADMDVYPIMADINTEVNAFYADTVYAKCGGNVAMPIYIGGNVNIGDFVMEVYYDADILHFERLDSRADGITVMNDAEKGCLTLKRAGGAVLTSPCSLVTLCFTSIGEDGYETELLLRPKETYTVANGEKVYTDSVAHDAELYLLQMK